MSVDKKNPLVKPTLGCADKMWGYRSWQKARWLGTPFKKIDDELPKGSNFANVQRRLKPARSHVTSEFAGYCAWTTSGQMPTLSV
jgi:hypothetical protein